MRDKLAVLFFFTIPASTQSERSLIAIHFENYYHCEKLLAYTWPDPISGQFFRSWTYYRLEAIRTIFPKGGANRKPEISRFWDLSSWLADRGPATN
jgi:hypothetical protein